MLASEGAERAFQKFCSLYAPVYADPGRPPNNARFVFLDPHATEFFRDWDKVASDTVAMLRAEAGRDPYDRGLSDLIGELSTRSDQFRVRWAAHNVRIQPPASSSSTTRSSGTSSSRSNPSRSPPNPARACSPTPPSPVPPRTTH
jgi:MmyB-like transcription regulator ligand binding domain